MTHSSNRVEVIMAVPGAGRQRRTLDAGMTVRLVAAEVAAPNQLCTWRRLVAQGSLTAAAGSGEVVPASEYRALQNQVRELHCLLGNELHRLLGKKTPEAGLLKEALEHATG